MSNFAAMFVKSCKGLSCWICNAEFNSGVVSSEHEFPVRMEFFLVRKRLH